MDRNTAIAEIKKNLKARSDRPWSVTGGRGTIWGWIKVIAPPRRIVNGEMTEADRQELCRLLNLEYVHIQGLNIPASYGHYQEYADRSAGIAPTKICQVYWD